MNKTSLLAAALFAASAAVAQAGELYAPAQYQDGPGKLTRAQVKQGVLADRRAGALQHDDVDLPGHGTLMTDGSHEFGRTRASVKADVLVARKAGELGHDDVDLPGVAQGSQLTRKQVRDEAIASRRLVNTAPGRNTIDY